MRSKMQTGSEACIGWSDLFRVICVSKWWLRWRPAKVAGLLQPASVSRREVEPLPLRDRFGDAGQDGQTPQARAAPGIHCRGDKADTPIDAACIER